MHINEETKARNWKAARRMFKLADELGYPDHEIAREMGKKTVTIAGWRDGNKGGTPMPLEKIERMIELLKEKKAARQVSNGTPAAPLLLEEKPLHKEGADAWRDGYATGFEAGVKYAERRAVVGGER